MSDSKKTPIEKLIETKATEEKIESKVNTDKAAIEARLDRKAKLKESFNYAGPMHVNMDYVKPGMLPQWVHDKGDEMNKYKSLGYIHVQNSKGENISVVVYERGESRGMKAFLMQADKEIFDDLDEIRREKADEALGDLHKQAQSTSPNAGLKFIK